MINAKLAKINVDSPYYTGHEEDMCMKAPIYDLIIGNVKGVRDTQMHSGARRMALQKLQLCKHVAKWNGKNKPQSHS